MAIPFLSGLRVHDSITLSDSIAIKWETNNILSHNGTQTYLGDATSASVLTLNGGNATFTGNIEATSYIKTDSNLLTGAQLKIKPEGQSSHEISIGSTTDRHLDLRVGTSASSAVRALRLHYNTLDATFEGNVTTDKIFVAKGQNLAHTASSIKVSQENTTKSQIRFYGADTSTAGILEFTGSSSDGSAGGVRLTINADGSSTFTGAVAATLSTAAQPNITSLGTLTTLTVDDITINGSTISDGADLSIDVGADLTLDAGGGDIILSDDGTIVGTISMNNNSGDLYIRSRVSDKDILFRGNDGGSEITALTLDMSDAGTAEFGNRVYIPEYIAHVGDSDTLFGFSGADTFILNTGGTTRLTVTDSAATFAGNILMGNTVVNPASGFSDQTGIGLKYSTTVPELQVSSDSTALQLGRTSTGGGGQIMAMRAASTTVHDFRTSYYHTTAAVGIGAAPASGMLDVKGADTDNTVLARFYSNTSSRGSFIIRNGSGVSPTTFIGTAGGSEELSIGTNNTEAIRLDAANQTATFKNTLTVENAFNVKAGASGNNVGGISWASTDSGFVFAKTGNATKVYLNSAGDSYLTGGQLGIGTATPQTKLQVNGTHSTFQAHVGQGQDNSDGRYGGISLGYAENGNANYRKVGIVAEAHGDGAARQDFHILVDTANDGNSAALADSKFKIDGLTGAATFAGEVNVPSGKISILGGNNLTISGTAANHAGLSFGTNIIYPATAAGTNDNTFDLGDPDERFKDAYFGGTVNATNVTISGTLSGAGSFVPVGGGTFTGNVIMDNSGSGDRSLTISTTTGGDPTIIMNSDAANRSGLINFQDNGTQSGQITYKHSGDTMEFYTGGASSAGHLELKLNETTGATFRTRVGIGATATDFHADADDLVVGAGSGNTGITIHSGTSDYGSIFFADGTADDATEKRGQIRYLQGTERMDFHTDNVATAALSLAANGTATFAGNITAVRGFFNSGATNVVATFTSTDGTATIQCADDSGNVEFGASGNNFVVQPAGGVAQLTVGASSSTFAGSATIETGINLESGVLVVKNATGDSNGLRIFQDSSDASKIYNNYNGTLQLGVGNTTAITIDSSENTTFAGDILGSTSTQIYAGPASTNGGRVLAQNYSSPHHLGVISSHYSNGNIMIGYGAEGKSGGSGYVSTYANFSGDRSVLEIAAASLNFKTVGSAVQTAVGSDITLASRFSVDTSGNGTFAGNITSTGTVITLDSAGSAGYIADRANDTSGATYEYKTGGSLKWYTGLRGVSTEDFYIFNNAQGSTALLLNSSNNNATFAGAIIQSMSNPYTKMIDTSSGGDDYGLNNNQSKFSIYNWTDGREELYFGGDGNATFTGDVTINGNFSLTQHIGLTDASIPSWHANVTSSMTYKDQMTLFSRADETYIGQNFYYGGSDAGKSIEAGKATLMRLRRGEINMYFSTASVNADTAVTLSEKFTFTDAGNFIAQNNITVTGNLIGKSDHTTELGDYSNGQIKRIRMSQGGEAVFGDSSTANPIGLTEGVWNSFGDSDYMSIYSRNSFRIYGYGTSATPQLHTFVGRHTSSGGSFLGVGNITSSNGTYGASNTILTVKGTTSGGEGIVQIVGLGNNATDNVGCLAFHSYAEADPMASIRSVRGNADDVGSLTFNTNNGGTESVVLTLANDGLSTFTGDVVSPGIYVGSRNASFDFYNNGTTYLNGAVTVDDVLTVTSTTSPLLVLNPTANNYGGINFQYGGANKGAAMYNSGMMVFGGESGTFTRLQAGGQYGLHIDATNQNVHVGSTSDTSYKLAVNGTFYSSGVATFAGKIKVDATPVANVGVAEFHDSSTDTYTTTAFNNYPTTTLYGVNTADTYVGTRLTHAGNTEMFVGVVKGSNNGELKYVFQGYNGSAYQEFGYIDCYSTGAGSLVMSGDVVAYSDKKLKKNIKTLDGSKVYDMRGVSFTRKDTEKEGSGVIAQEMQEVAPELVNESSDGTLGVSYGNITGYLIEAIKDLKAEVEELKKHKCNCNGSTK